jgi:CheY-like chemotaxis protein
MEQDSVNLLVVEDNAFDLRMLERAMRSSGFEMPMRVASNGLEALDILRGTGEHEGLPRPNLVLLDLNMPKMDGHTFLSHLRHDDILQDLVVFVHTTSEAKNDIRRAYSQHVAGYIVKEGRLDSSVEDLQMLVNYTRRVTLPIEAA